MDEKLKNALSYLLWIQHKIGDEYYLIHTDNKLDRGWKIAYYPLFGTYKGEKENKYWVEFNEPRALIEKKIENGTDFRELPLRYLMKQL